jgi:hypothetical protein
MATPVIVFTAWVAITRCARSEAAGLFDIGVSAPCARELSVGRRLAFYSAALDYSIQVVKIIS